MLAFKPHASCTSVAFSPDGSRMLTCGGYPHVRVSDSLTGETIWAADAPTTDGWGTGAEFMNADFFAAGDFVFATQWRHGFVLNAATGEFAPGFRLPCHGYGLAVHPGVRLVAVQSVQDDGDIFTTDPLDPGAGTSFFGTPAACVNALAWSPDGSRFAAVGIAGLTLAATDPAELLTRWHAPAAHGAGGLAFTPDGSRVIFSAGPKVFAVPAAGGTPQELFRLPKKHIQDLAITPDGKRILTVSNEGTVRVWDAESGAADREFAWKIGLLKGVAVSPDGGRAAAVSNRGRVVVWDLE